MTTLNDVRSEITRIQSKYQFCSPRMAARELAEIFDDVEVIEAPTQDSALIACAECFAKVQWMNRKHFRIIAREFACPEL